MKKMRANVIRGVSQFGVEEVPRPRAQAGEAVIRITLTTICGTDLHIVRGEYPVRPGLVIGHEPVGVIDELGESLIAVVRDMQPQRLFLDGMQGFERATDFSERLSHVYSAIAHELEQLGVTTLYSTETRELFASNIQCHLISVIP